MTSSSAQSTDAVSANVSREIVPLSRIAKIVSGFGFPKSLQGKTEGDFPFFKVGDISAAWNSGRQLLITAQHYLSEEEAKSIKAKAFPKGTIVFAKIGEAIKLNRRAILGQPALVDNNVMGLIPDHDVVDHRYLFYWTLTQKLGEISQATTVPSIRKSDVEELEFPLVLIDQQKRIVAEIEKQFSRLDEAVANLKRVKANLKRYKAAVLKAAVEGRLVETEAERARREGRSYETGAQLLQRILETRRSLWKGKGKYKEPAAPGAADLPELPEGWVWATIGQAAECLDSKRIPVNKKERLNRPGEIPYYGANGRVGFIDDYLFDEPLVLVVEDETFTGRELPFSYKISGKSWVNNHAHVLRPTSIVTLDYLNYALSFYPFTPLTTGTTGRKKLTQLALMTAPLGIPPLSEQKRIVAEVERSLSIADEAESQVNVNLHRAVRLRQAILGKAFSARQNKYALELSA